MMGRAGHGRSMFIIVGFLLLFGTACRRGATAVPTDVEIDWPDAAPYELDTVDASPTTPAPPDASPSGHDSSVATDAGQPG